MWMWLPWLAQNRTRDDCLKWIITVLEPRRWNCQFREKRAGRVFFERVHSPHGVTGHWRYYESCTIGEWKGDVTRWIVLSHTAWCILVHCVALIYNDPTTSIAFKFSGVMTGIDASRLHLCYRTGEELKRHYAGIRSHFTTMYEWWSRSQQNNSDNFEQFWPKQRSSTTLNADGNKCVVLFKVLC